MIENLDEIITEMRDTIPEHSFVRKIGKKFFHGKSSKLYVVTPYWSAKMSEFSIRLLKRRILNAGHSCLIYQFPVKILSGNIYLTEEYFKEIKKDVRKDIKIFRSKYNFTEVIVIGMSLGCVNAPMISNDNPDVDGLILIVPGDSLAEGLWYGIGATKIKSLIKKHNINFQELEKDWKDLAPRNNIDNLFGKNIEIYISKSDEVIPYKTGSKLVKEMKDRGLNPLVIKNKNLGHYLTILKFIFLKKF